MELMRYRIVEGLGSVLHKPYALIISEWLAAESMRSATPVTVKRAMSKNKSEGVCPAAVCLFWCCANEARDDNRYEPNRRNSHLPKQGVLRRGRVFIFSFFRLLLSFKRIVTPPLPNLPPHTVSASRLCRDGDAEGRAIW